MQRCFGEVKKVVMLNEKSDSCAKHSVTQFCDTHSSATIQRDKIAGDIVWHGNPTDAVNTFAAKNCALMPKKSSANPQVLIATPTMKSLASVNTACNSTGTESRPPQWAAPKAAGQHMGENAAHSLHSRIGLIQMNFCHRSDGLEWQFFCNCNDSKSSGAATFASCSSKTGRTRL